MNAPMKSKESLSLKQGQPSGLASHGSCQTASQSYLAYGTAAQPYQASKQLVGSLAGDTDRSPDGDTVTQSISTQPDRPARSTTGSEDVYSIDEGLSTWGPDGDLGEWQAASELTGADNGHTAQGKNEAGRSQVTRKARHVEVRGAWAGHVLWNGRCEPCRRGKYTGCDWVKLGHHDDGTEADITVRCTRCLMRGLSEQQCEKKARTPMPSRYRLSRQRGSGTKAGASFGQGAGSG